MGFVSLRDIPHEFIITIGDFVLPTDLELFFSFNKKRWEYKYVKGLSCTYYHHFNKDITMAELAVKLDQMPSKGQARKNGWDNVIPEGYSEFKRKFHKFYILKLTKELL